MISNTEVNWLEPWSRVEDEKEAQSLQKELDLEVGPSHPLWKTGASVIGRHVGNDDIVVALQDGRYAMVHLLWGGKTDCRPETYPWTSFYETVEKLQTAMDEESKAWGS